MSIVVGVRDTRVGRLAVGRAVDEARLRGGPLVLVAGVEFPRSEEGAVRYEQQRRELIELLETHAAGLSHEEFEVMVRVPRAPTSAADTVLQVAEEVDATLIVVGLRRRSAVGKAFLGSTAQDIILGAQCPVLGVKLPRSVEVG